MIETIAESSEIMEVCSAIIVISIKNGVVKPSSNFGSACNVLNFGKGMNLHLYNVSRSLNSYMLKHI